MDSFMYETFYISLRLYHELINNEFVPFTRGEESREKNLCLRARKREREI